MLSTLLYGQIGADRYDLGWIMLHKQNGARLEILPILTSSDFSCLYVPQPRSSAPSPEVHLLIFHMVNLFLNFFIEFKRTV